MKFWLYDLNTIAVFYRKKIFEIWYKQIKVKEATLLLQKYQNFGNKEFKGILILTLR